MTNAEVAVGNARARLDRGRADESPPAYLIGSGTIVRCTALLTAAVLLSSLANSDRGRAAEPKRNVLFISVDDMNDWVGALGYAPAKTPNIDRLAARGTLFTNAHAPSPKCNPSRTAILSGLRPSTTGIYGNGEWWKPNHPDIIMLPRYFRENGYYVAGGGKVFHHTPGFNPPESWDEYFDLVDDLKKDEFLISYREPRHIPSFDWGALDRSDMDMGDGATVRWAEEFLARQHKTPFFLAVGLFQPHLPFYAPQHWHDQVKPIDAPVPAAPPDDLNDVPQPGQRLAASRRADLELIEKHQDLPDIVRAYTACIRHADALIGRILDALDTSPHAEDTIVVFWSDHGYHFGEKRHFAKDTLWERSTRVPLALIAPGVTQMGTVSTRPVSLLDLYPSLVDLCGLPSRSELEGASLRPLLEDPGRDWDRPAVITFGRGNHAVRSEHWRYIRYAEGDEELYDHRVDPDEFHNLASDLRFADVIAEHSRWLPQRNAPGALRKSAFEFDPATYTWRRKNGETEQ